MKAVSIFLKSPIKSNLAKNNCLVVLQVSQKDSVGQSDFFYIILIFLILIFLGGYILFGGFEAQKIKWSQTHKYFVMIKWFITQQ